MGGGLGSSGEAAGRLQGGESGASDNTIIIRMPASNLGLAWDVCKIWKRISERACLAAHKGCMEGQEEVGWVAGGYSERPGLLRSQGPLSSEVNRGATASYSVQHPGQGYSHNHSCHSVGFKLFCRLWVLKGGNIKRRAVASTASWGFLPSSYAILNPSSVSILFKVWRWILSPRDCFMWGKFPM